MLFPKLLPQDGNFFKLFNQHAECVVSAARALAQLVANYDDTVLREKFTREVDDAEHAADRITYEVSKTLHKTFITPRQRGALGRRGQTSSGRGYSPSPRAPSSPRSGTG